MFRRLNWAVNIKIGFSCGWYWFACIRLNYTWTISSCYDGNTRHESKSKTKKLKNIWAVFDASIFIDSNLCVDEPNARRNNQNATRINKITKMSETFDFNWVSGIAGGGMNFNRISPIHSIDDCIYNFWLCRLNRLRREQRRIRKVVTLFNFPIATRCHYLFLICSCCLSRSLALRALSIRMHFD